MAETEQPTVWREGTRIRNAEGTGYSDRVSDNDIKGHIFKDRLEGETWPGAIDFSLDVLALRARERSNAGEAPA